jgi:surface antigen
MLSRWRGLEAAFDDETISRMLKMHALRRSKMLAAIRRPDSARFEAGASGCRLPDGPSEIRPDTGQQTADSRPGRAGAERLRGGGPRDPAAPDHENGKDRSGGSGLLAVLDALRSTAGAGAAHRDPHLLGARRRRPRSTHVARGQTPPGTSTAPRPGMLTKLTSIVLGTCLIASAGCAHESETGAAVGAGAGGILGAAAGGVGWGLFGAAVGGLLGYGVGSQVEAENERRMTEAIAAGQPKTWTADQGHVYTVEPQQVFYDGGRPCRRYRLLAHVEGQPHEVYGTACQQPDGRWEAVNPG